MYLYVLRLTHDADIALQVKIDQICDPKMESERDYWGLQSAQI